MRVRSRGGGEEGYVEVVEMRVSRQGRRRGRILSSLKCSKTIICN